MRLADESSKKNFVASIYIDCLNYIFMYESESVIIFMHIYILYIRTRVTREQAQEVRV